ncbi:MAG: BamA/TamA family outer membrane protein [Chlorobi bacterium]|nr:BamA/TamA family outer membrane protein [Chlorobiota bacterium]
MKFILLNIISAVLFLNVFAQSEKQYELESISYIGNSYFSDAELNDVVSLRESPSSISQYLNGLIGLGEEAVYFDSLALPEEELKLKSFYFNNGFFDAKISSTYFLDSADYECYVVFEIREGKVSKINKITAFGLNDISSYHKGMIKSMINVDTTENYSYTKISGINSNVTNYLRNNGYMFAEFDSTTIYIDTMKNIVKAELYFTHGKEYDLSEINVEKSGVGKDEVDTDLIKEVADLNKGDIYSEYNIRLAQSRLYRTNLFNIAYVKNEIEDTVGNTVPINISTEIGNMYEIAPEIIMNNEDNRFNLGLSVGFSKKNFLGGARILTLNGSIASQNIFEFLKNISVYNTTVIGYADLRLILEQPFLFGENILTRTELYTTLQKRRDEYNTTANGLKFTFNFELPEFVYLTSFNTSWNFENLKVLYQQNYLENVFKSYLGNNQDLTPEQKDSLAAGIAEKIVKVTSSNNTLLAFNLGANKTDDFTFPTRGYKTNLLIGNANALPLLLSKIKKDELKSPLYFKTQIDFSVFPSIYHSNKNAFGIKLRVGIISVYDGLESSVPYNQRFTAGGSNSVRGWQSRELVPEFSFGKFDFTSISPVDLEAILLDQAAPGGLFLLEGSIETRNRLIGNIGTALFLDWGNSWANAKSFRFDQIAVSTGFGFRYYTDFIPFRLDFGIKLYDPISGVPVMKQRFWKDTLQIHFAIGEAF